MLPSVCICQSIRVSANVHYSIHPTVITSIHVQWLELQCSYLSQLMRLWYLPHRWPAKAQVSLHIHAVLPEPSLFEHMKYGSKQRVGPKIRHLAALDGCACMFEEWILQRTKSAIISWDGSFDVKILKIMYTDNEGMLKTFAEKKTCFYNRKVTNTWPS